MANQPTSSGFAPRRILVRGVNWLGDAVMTTPALARLREVFPEAHIALLTPQKLADLWLHHPAIDETISFAPDEGLFAIASRLRAGRFDLAIVLPNSPRSALEIWLGRIPRRTGYTRPWRNFFLTSPVPPRPGAVRMRKPSIEEIQQLIRQPETRKEQKAIPKEAHQIFDYLQLVATLGGNPEPAPLQLSVRQVEIESVREKFGLKEI